VARAEAVEGHTIGGIHAHLRADLRSRKRRKAKGNPYEGLDRELNPSNFRPRLASDVEFMTFTRRSGERYTMLKTPHGPSYVKLSDEERDIVDQMDGSKSVKEIVVADFKRTGTFSLSAVADLVDELRQGNFLDTRYLPVAEMAVAAKRRRRFVPKGLSRALRERRIEFPGAPRFFRAMYRYGGRIFFTSPVAFVSVVVSAVGAVAFVILLGRGKFSLLGSSAASGLLVLYGIEMFSTFIHESGHALAVYHAKRNVNAAGFMLYLGIPIFFIDTTDVWMADRRARILTSVAGPFSECIMAGAASVIALSFPAGPTTAFLFRFAVLSYIAIAQNLIPFLRLDGYYILMDTVDEANLREQSFEFVRHDLYRKLLGREKLSRKEKWFTSYGALAGVFAVLAVMFSTLFWSRILRTAVKSAWHGGWISRILVALLILLILAPLLRAIVRLVRRTARRIRALFKLARRAAERTWRAEAVEMFRSLPLTDDLPEESLVEIAEHVRLLRFQGGQSVVRAGDRADDFFVVRSGTFEIALPQDDGSERVVRKIDRGRSFGEIALLESTTRTATVRALEPSQVFAIDKGTFDRVLSDNVEIADELRPQLLSMGRIRSLGPFSGLDDADVTRMIKGADWHSFAPGERIVKQGDEARSFFVIASGQVDVIENRKIKRRIGAGGYFGDTALLENIPRTATVRAATPAQILELDRKAFEKVLAKSFRRGRLAPSRALSRDWEH